MSSEASLRIGKTEIELLKENTYSIRTNDYIVDSLRENVEILHNKHMKKIELSGTLSSSSPLYSKRQIEINASSVMPLQTFLSKASNQKGVSYDVLLHFLGNIGNQLTFLKKKGYAIPFISLEDIIVIDGIIFAFVNDDKVFKIEDTMAGEDSEHSEHSEDGGDERNERNERNARNKENPQNIIIDFPMKFNKKNSFIPSTIKKYFGSGDNKGKKLPIIIHHSWGFYSLAQLCVFIFLRKSIANLADYENIAGPFIYTPLYWCLKRCLDKNNSKRILLYI